MMPSLKLEELSNRPSGIEELKENQIWRNLRCQNKDVSIHIVLPGQSNIPCFRAIHLLVTETEQCSKPVLVDDCRLNLCQPWINNPKRLFNWVGGYHFTKRL